MSCAFSDGQSANASLRILSVVVIFFLLCIPMILNHFFKTIMPNVKLRGGKALILK